MKNIQKKLSIYFLFFIALFLLLENNWCRSDVIGTYFFVAEITFIPAIFLCTYLIIKEIHKKNQ